MKNERTKQQSGFAILESLLILIIIAIIGGTGYYVYHSKQETDKTLASAQAENTSAPTVKKSSSNINIYKFKDLGVQFYTKGELAGLNFIKQDGYYYLVDNKFLAVLKTCSDYKAGDYGGGFAAISKVNGQYPPNANPIQDGALLKQFPDFWISWGVPNGNGCSDLSKAQSLHDAASAEAQKFYGDFQNTATLVQ